MVIIFHAGTDAAPVDKRGNLDSKLHLLSGGRVDLRVLNLETLHYYWGAVHYTRLRGFLQ